MTETPNPERKRNGSSSLSLSAIFETLALRRRRTILYCLTEHADDTIGFQGLVDAVAARESETDRQRRTWAPQRQRVATALHHDDLPRLAEAGLVEYDHWCGEVRYNRDDRVDDWIDRAAEHDRDGEHDYEHDHHF